MSKKIKREHILRGSSEKESEGIVSPSLAENVGLGELDVLVAGRSHKSVEDFECQKQHSGESKSFLEGKNIIRD